MDVGLCAILNADGIRNRVKTVFPGTAHNRPHQSTLRQHGKWPNPVVMR